MITKKKKYVIYAVLTLIIVYSMLFIIGFISIGQVPWGLFGQKLITPLSLKFSTDGKYLSVKTRFADYLWNLNDDRIFEIGSHFTGNSCFSFDSRYFAFFNNNQAHISVLNLYDRKIHKIKTKDLSPSIAGFTPDSSELVFIDNEKMNYYDIDKNLLANSVNIPDYSSLIGNGDIQNYRYFALSEEIKGNYLAKAWLRKDDDGNDKLRLALVNENLIELISFDMEKLGCRYLEETEETNGTKLYYIDDSMIFSFDLDTEKMEKLDIKLSANIYIIAVSENGNFLAYAAKNSNEIINIYDLSKKIDVPITLKVEKRWIRDISINERNKSIAVAFENETWKNGTVVMYDFDSGEKTKEIQFKRAEKIE